jgi:hypothetical protein
MNLEKIDKLIEEIKKKGDISHRILAHASARYILFNVNEPEENHPNFLSDLSFRVDNLAFSCLEIGCSLVENQRYDLAKNFLTKAAMLIEYNHLPIQNRNEFSKYYILISALTYYLSAEFSKAFIVLKKTEQDTDLSLLISYFLKRDFRSIVNQLNSILLNDKYVKNENKENIDVKISAFLFAKAIANIFEYIFSGNDDYIKKAHEIFNGLIEFSKINYDPGLWWIVRLFKLTLKTLTDNSLWKTIPNKLNPEQSDDKWEISDDIIKQFPFLNQYSNKTIIENYINCLIHRKNPIVELFVTQKKALNKILSDNGAVIALPTSSGKTRIAEIAILQSLIKNKTGKILYLAPFRSLAFEIEKTLSETFIPLNYTISHLYGGSQFSKLDQTLINEAHILVATPEKAKAILRANKEIANQIKLIIIDEGHLIDTSKRNVTNELFIDELKYYIKNNNGKIILLSAVLPNAEDISEWITGGKDNFVQANWRPSSQRMGLLEFIGKNVNINWYNPENEEEIPTYNYNFIKPFKKNNSKIFPENKEEAVAATAVRLSEIGSVLIFVGGTRNVEATVFKYASSVKTAFQDKLEEIDWGDLPEWKEFKLICEETYGENSKLLNFAKYGILCHHGKFPNIVRIALDRLLATKKPKIIISTTTLAQGVNLGVSSVIFANVYVSGKPISVNDFWNIAGRAGRAFIDTEGKMLYAIDKTKTESSWKLQIKLAENYFKKSNLNEIESGLLQYLRLILKISEDCNISFDTLLQLISENDFSKIKTTHKDYSDAIKDFFDWTDDVLLTYEIYNESEEWVDTYFRNSLAYLQAKKKDESLAEKIIQILKARRDALIKIVDQPEKRKEFVVSGLPLMSIQQLDKDFDHIIEIADTYLLSDGTIDDLVLFVSEIEEIISLLPSSAFQHKFSIDDINIIRKVWFSGEKLIEIAKKVKNAYTIINSYFGYTIPWGFNAIARKFYFLNDEPKGNLFEELSVLSELGLPNFSAARIYLAGIYSRVASVELSEILPDKLVTEKNRAQLLRYLINNKKQIIKNCSNQETKNWLELIEKFKLEKKRRIKKISDFIFKNENLTIKSKVMFVRSFNNKYFFVSPDYEEKINIGVSKEFPFDRLANRTDIYFRFEDNAWKMGSRNPRLKLV